MRKGAGRIRGLFAVIAGVAAAAVVCAAESQKIGADGTVHRVSLEPVDAAHALSGTLVRHKVQAADGQESSQIVPGTDDGAIESSPLLAIDPADGSMVLAWLRQEGGRSEVRMTRWRKDSWEEPIAPAGPSTRVEDFRVTVGNGWINLVWTESSSTGRSAWRGVYRTGDFRLEYGPESLPTDTVDTGSASPDPSGGDPRPDIVHRFVALHLPASKPGEAGSIHLWGIRDEPVPIGYHEGHELGRDQDDVRDLGARWIGGKLTYWFHDGGRFQYRSRQEGLWGAFQLVELDSETCADAARLQMEEMLRRR